MDNTKDTEIENKDQIDNEKERIKKLSKMVWDFMKLQNMSMEEALTYIFKNRDDKRNVKERLKQDQFIRQENERIFLNGGDKIYWTMNKATTKCLGVDYDRRGWHKMKTQFDEFF